MSELNDFINGMTKIVENETVESIIVEKTTELMGILIDTPFWLNDENKKTDQSIGYGRHQLYCDSQNRFEILAMVWDPGQKTPLHDHDGTWGVEGVLSGKLKISNYLRIGKINDNTERLTSSGSVVVSSKSTGELLPPADCHILEVVDDETVITIHIYGKQLKKFSIYKPTSKKDIFKKKTHYTAYTT